MATINWPADLPQCFLVSGFGDGLPDNTLRDEFDVGPSTIRRRSTAAPYPLVGRMVMDTAQWLALKEFHKSATLGGTLAFGFPAVDDEDDLLVRFTSHPKRSYAAPDAWEVSIELEVLP